MYLPIAFVFFCFIVAVFVAIAWLMRRVDDIEDQLAANELLDNIRAEKEKTNAE